jgi:NAD(P)-dependent dehydrogenase (short-subunit alcohol dehydrogenase family)
MKLVMGESNMRGRLSGKSALISGAASGLGEAQAILYAREGASVLIGDLQHAKGNAVVDLIKSEGGEAAFIALDVTDAESWDAAVVDAVRRFGQLTTPLNNAGIFQPGGIVDETKQGSDHMIAVNQTGGF